MKVPFLTSLRGRLVLLLGLAIGPWFIAMAYNMWSDWRKAVVQATDDARRLARATAVEQDHMLNTARNLLYVLSTLPEIREGTGEACSKRLRAIYAGTRGYANFLVVDDRGRLVCTAREGKNEYSDRDWYREVMKSPRFYVGRYVIGKIVGKPVLPVVYPVLDRKGGVKRIVLVALDVAWLGQVLHPADEARGAIINILDNQSVVVARHPSDPSMIGKPHEMAWFRDAIASGHVVGMAEGRLPDGRERIAAFERLSSAGARTGMYVVVSLSKAKVLAPVLRDFQYRLLFLGAFSLLILAVVWRLTEIIVLRRLAQMSQVAKRIAARDFGARTDLGPGHGELSELAQSFDEMAASLEQSFQQMQRVMEVAPEAIILVDGDGRIVQNNQHTESMFGYSREELVGQPVELLIPESQRANHVQQREGYRRQPRVREMGTKNLNLAGRRKDGTTFPVDVSLGPLKTKQGLWVVAAVRDVSERRRYEDEILHQATHDALTGLPNRALFRELLENGMAQTRRAENLLAVLFLDLDGFKNINDTLGHAEGDELLRAMSKRITDALRKGDVVARQGGDEFTILLSGINMVEDITLVVDKLLATIAAPNLLGAREIQITVSIGITVFPLDDADADSLLRNADTAMYQAKAGGKNTFRFYTPEMNVAAHVRLETESGLRQALRDGLFELHYQPQVRVETGDIVGVEALIRWRHPERGLIAPAEFIPVAEDCGLIEPIGEWVLATACRQIKAWQAKGLGDIKVAVNLSARQFHRPNLLDVISRVLAESGVDACPELLELELTESMVMRDTERSIATMQRLRELGLKLSIDDFGTGYSSLSYLKRFPVCMLKIDRSFIDGVNTDRDDASIARTIVDLGHNLNLDVIAEGVETEAQWRWLQQAGCDQAQGYLFGKPMPVEELEVLLCAGSRLSAGQTRV